MRRDIWRDQLVEQHAAIAAEVLGAGRADTDSSVLVGSVVAGYGTPYSDVDLLVFTDGATDTPRVPDPSGTPDPAGGRVDVERLRLADALALISDLDAYDVTPSDASQLYRAADALELFCRLMSSPRILRNSDGLNSLLARCQAVAESATRIRVSRATLLANNTLEDTLGFLEIGDIRSALYSSGTMLQFGMDALCSALGDTYFGHKWNVQRVRAVLGEDTTYCRGLLHTLDPGDGAIATTVHRRIEINQQLLAVANVSAWLPVAVQLELPRPDAPQGVLRRDRHWHLLKYNEQWAMSNGRQSYEVPWTAVLVWGLSGGLAEAELAESAATEIGKALHRPVPLALPQSLIQRLRELGALIDETREGTERRG